ncbi:peptidase M28 [Teratosphaeria nubilosa]|uniref:Peptide hydrolase n=1 Tax=Teratosphaeria nubilosa TaxID=161662 RepID=A0A6G1L7J6_9PEZI|nr:peptidase M28 [Teratosphaeria nubilosa]
MFLTSAAAAALLPFLGANAKSGNYSTTWEGLPGALNAEWALCPSASWPPTNYIGKPLVSQAPDAELQEMLSEVSVERVQSIVTTLTNFGTRHTLSQQNSSTRGIGAARDRIYKEMLDLAAPSNGSMDVYFNSYIQGVASRISFPVNITNVVAQINGTDDPNRAYVVTGHYDSRRIDIMDYTNDAPGSDDDATGVAVVMEMARICAKRKPKATMIFAATAGEEQDLYGSAHLAQILKNASLNVEGNWNNDIVGTGTSQPFAPINNYTIRLFGASIFYPNVSTAALDNEIGIIGGWNDSPAQNLGRYIAEIAAGAARWVGMQVALIYRSDRYLRGGDHESFLAQGFPAVRLTEAVEDFAHQHQDPRVQDNITYGDLLEFVDFDCTSRVAKVNLASMWSAANAPAMPVNVTISEEITNDSQFAWATGNDALVSSHELVWRPSGALQWSYSLDVGDVGNVTVNLSKDSLQFGVRAVGANGWKSPAVFPLPTTA